MINFKKEKIHGINRPIFYKRVGVWDWIGSFSIANYLRHFLVGGVGFFFGYFFNRLPNIFHQIQIF